MEATFQCGSILEDLFYGYNMATSSPNRRSRKVTITEIMEDGIWSKDTETESVDAEKAFQALDESIKGWKTQLEETIGEGLGKLKKNLKEKRLSVAYLPGVNSTRDEMGILNKAKLLAVTDCKDEHMKILSTMLKNIDKIFATSLQPLKHEETKDMNSNKKTLVNIDYSTGGGLKHLKQLLTDLDNLTGNASWKLTNNSFPIYNPMKKKDYHKCSLMKRGCTEVLPSYNRIVFPSFGPARKPAKREKKITRIQNLTIDSLLQPSINIVDEFRIKHYENSIKKAQTKPQRKERNTTQAHKRMHERKQNKKYRLCEYVNRKGEHKIFIAKRNASISSLEVEDLYFDWLKLIEPTFLKPLKLIQDELTFTGPLLYSEALKKNLALSYETPQDIFDDWQDHLSADMGAFPKLSVMPKKTKKEGTEPEDYFQCWKHHLSFILSDYEESPYQIERIFNSWRRNLFERKLSSNKIPHADNAESFFCDWLHNFNEKPPNILNRRKSRRQSNKKRCHSSSEAQHKINNVENFPRTKHNRNRNKVDVE